MVNCTEDFKDQPKVINGYSDLMVEIFGVNGIHARSAVGMYALPMNMAVEIEVIVEIQKYKNLPIVAICQKNAAFRNI